MTWRFDAGEINAFVGSATQPPWPFSLVHGASFQPPFCAKNKKTVIISLFDATFVLFLVLFHHY